MEEGVTDFRRKLSVAALYHLQDFMDASNHNPIKWEDLTYDNTNQYVLGSYASYIDKFARNKTMVNLADVNP